MGLGLGMAYSEGSQLIRSTHDAILDSALNKYDSDHQKQSKEAEK